MYNEMCQKQYSENIFESTVSSFESTKQNAEEFLEECFVFFVISRIRFL